MLKNWQALNSQLPTFLATLLDARRVSVRQARVAASFITWLGCQAGLGFIHRAEALCENHAWPEMAYLAAWGLENRRPHIHANQGVRTIEVILSPESLFLNTTNVYQSRERAAKLAITVSDLDTVEAMVSWLSTPTGRAFFESSWEEHRANRAKKHAHELAVLNSALDKLTA